MERRRMGRWERDTKEGSVGSALVPDIVSHKTAQSIEEIEQRARAHMKKEENGDVEKGKGKG